MPTAAKTPGTPDIDNASSGATPPILRLKELNAASAFTPESLIREAARQKAIPDLALPEVCILDPDGDIVRFLRTQGRSRPAKAWACYHSEMDVFALAGREIGIVGCAVGGAYAVLVAEQMFAAGCRLLISITSAGQIVGVREPPYFILIDRALRDEGTSYHYLAASDFAGLDPGLGAAVAAVLADAPEPVERGASWTTDAPFRETAAAIAAAKELGILAVEMEAASLYAFASARNKPVVCFAHITNRMGVAGDFEKGEANGANAGLALIEAVLRAGPELLPPGR